MKMKVALSAVALATALLVGCGGTSDHVNEKYVGVKSHIACEDLYKLPANVAKCVREDGRGGK
jgi:hypothetical protein